MASKLPCVWINVTESGELALSPPRDYGVQPSMGVFRLHQDNPLMLPTGWSTTEYAPASDLSKLQAASRALLDAIANEQTTEAACEGGTYDVLNDMAVYYKDIRGEIVTLEALLPPREPTHA